MGNHGGDFSFCTRYSSRRAQHPHDFDMSPGKFSFNSARARSSKAIGTCDTFWDVSPDEFYAVIDDEIVGLEQHFELPDEFLRSVPRQLDVVLETSTLAIGGWDNSSDGPLVLALGSTGQIVSVVAVNPGQLPALGDTLASIEYWLSSMTLPNLSELSGNSIEFYEGLLDLSPQSSIVLSPRRRFVLLTGVQDLDLAEVQARVPEADIDVVYLDVLRAPGGPAIIRRRSGSAVVAPATQVAPLRAEPVTVAPMTPPPVVEPGVEVVVDAPPPPTMAVHSPAIPDFAEIPEVDVAPMLDPDVSPLEPVASEYDFPVDVSIPAVPDVMIDESDDATDVRASQFTVAPEAPELIDLTETPPTIDLSDTVNPPTPTGVPVVPHIEPGHTYDLDVLPLLFDATGSTLESISSELFAVNDAIVIVAALPERRRDTPFEDRHRFRWDTSLERIQLLNEHGFTLDGTRRAVHLFVESERQPNYAVYIGELSRTAFQTQTQAVGETAWFSIAPSLDSDLYRMLRKGRLPQHEQGRAADITSS